MKNAIIAFSLICLQGASAILAPAQTWTTVDEYPEVIGRISPVYPESARRDRLEGTVVLNVLVNVKGNVERVEIKKGVRGDLDTAAANALRIATFKPGQKNGKPMSVFVSVPVKFRLAESETELRSSKEAPSTEEMNTVLSFLGVTVQRFEYELPYEHTLAFFVEEFSEGKSIEKTKLPSAKALGKGHHSFNVMIQRKDSSLHIGIGIDGLLNTYLFSNRHAKEKYAATANSTIGGARLKQEESIPFFVHVADFQKARSIKATESLQYYTSQFKYAFVVSAKLLPAQK